MGTVNGAIQAEALDQEEQNLVEEILRDPEMFADLYRRYLTRVYHYLRARVGDRAEAEDLTKQVFLDALEALPRYRAGMPFAAWLFTIARRRAADHHRRQARRGSQRHHAIRLDLDENQPSPSPDALEQVIRDERLARLRQLVDSLPVSEQELLRLRFAGGLSFNEIARVTRRKVSAVKMSLYRLLERLESQMGEKDG